MPPIGFGKRPNPRKFDYNPRYYDAEKEERDKRMAKYKNSGEQSEQEKVKDRIKSGLRQKYNNDPSYRSKQLRKSNIRLFYIIGILVMAAYLLLKSDLFRRFFESF